MATEIYSVSNYRIQISNDKIQHLKGARAAIYTCNIE
jgi:hypothetical protein